MATLNTILETQMALEASIAQRFAAFDVALKAAAPSPPTISSLNKEFGSFKEQVGTILQLLRQQIQSVNDTVDAIEMRHRRKYLVFSGIPEKTNEDIIDTVCNICHSSLKLPEVTRSSITACHRLSGNIEGRPRLVLVRFADLSLRNSVWGKKTALKGSSTVISEFLTKQRQAVFLGARKHFGMHSVWTADGNIIVKLANGKKARLTSSKQLEALMAEHAPKSGAPAPAAAKEAAAGPSKKTEERRGTRRAN